MVLANMFRVIMEHPLLMLVTVADIALIALILYFVLSKVVGKQRPGQKVKMLLHRFFVRIHPGNVENIESLYEYVVNTYIHRGVVSAEDGNGLKARERILDHAEDEERQVVKAIFDHYEGKKYGGGVWNEEKTVSNLFDRFRSI